MRCRDLDLERSNSRRRARERERDLLIASLHEVSFQAHGHLDVNVVLDVLLRDQLDLRVVLRDLVVRQQVQQVEAENGVLALRLANQAVKLIVEAP